jgi:hypothetical protein
MLRRIIFSGRMSAAGQKQIPTFVTAAAELASIADPKDAIVDLSFWLIKWHSQPRVNVSTAAPQ